MDEKYLLKRSSKGLWIQILSGGLLAFLGGLVATWALNGIFSWTPNQGRIVVGVTWVIFFAVWAVTSLKLWLDWNIKRYEIAEDALIIHAKAGSFGTAQTIYRYESIISIRMTQGFFGKRFGYGDVYISIPKIDYPIVMNDIIDPMNQIIQIKQRMGEHNNGATHALIN